MTQTVRHIFLLALTAMLLAACGQAPAPASSGDISAQELNERINTGDAPLILDVRSTDEYAAGHLPNARNIPHTELAERIGELGVTTTDEIVVHCYSGKRAGSAQTTLDSMGYTNVRHLEGDWQGWQAAGLPVD
jgi:phage shock protein E